MCHTGYSNSQFLLTKLKSVFGEQLALSGPYSSFDESTILEDSPQLVLSTTNLNMPAERPCVLINPILDRADIRQIKAHIEQIDKKYSDIGRMRRFFHEDHFFPRIIKKSPEEIIAFMADKLVRSGRVWPSFTKLVFEREDFSPTVIQNFIALPHPSVFCSHETTISVATLPRAVDWHGRKVQLVFLMAIREGDQRYLQDFYEFIVDLSEDLSRVQALLKIGDLDTFWQFMLDNNTNRQLKENG